MPTWFPSLRCPEGCMLGIPNAGWSSRGARHCAAIQQRSMAPMQAASAVAALQLFLGATLATPITISNVEPRRDAGGAIMDCHDGNIAHIAGEWWNFCMAYGPCHNHGCASDQCGGRLDHNISIYTSPNLTGGSWRYIADLLPVDKRLPGTYYRPKVVFNPTTSKFVFWVNVLPRPSATAPVDFSKSSYLVATSAAPGGPYEVVVQNATTKYGEGGDFSLFVDDDKTGYLIYTSLSEAHSISIAPLNADFTESLPKHNTAFLPGTGHTGCFEAPAMFKRQGLYYALVSICSCFGKGGADVWVFTAKSPLGPYTRHADLGNAEKAQQNYVFQAPLASGKTAFVWTGDRWKSTPDGEKAHDFQYWQPLNFTDPPYEAHGGPHSSPSPPVIQALMSATTLPAFTLDLKAST